MNPSMKQDILKKRQKEKSLDLPMFEKKPIFL